MLRNTHAIYHAFCPQYIRLHDCWLLFLLLPAVDLNWFANDSSVSFC